MRAFVLEPTMHDSTMAAAHGEIVMVFGHQRDHPPTFSHGFQVSLMKRLRDLRFDPEEDCLVITGQLVALTIAVAAMVAEYGPIRTLCFNAHADVREYEEIVMGEASTLATARGG
jgi:hypothetical protein